MHGILQVLRVSLLSAVVNSSSLLGTTSILVCTLRRFCITAPTLLMAGSEAKSKPTPNESIHRSCSKPTLGTPSSRVYSCSTSAFPRIRALTPHLGRSQHLQVHRLGYGQRPGDQDRTWKAGNPFSGSAVDQSFLFFPSSKDRFARQPVAFFDVALALCFSCNATRMVCKQLWVEWVWFGHLASRGS